MISTKTLCTVLFHQSKQIRTNLNRSGFGHSEIQEKRKKVQDLTAAREVDSEAAVKRLKDSETRLRADVAAVSATNDSLRTRLIESNDADYRRLLALQVWHVG